MIYKKNHIFMLYVHIYIYSYIVILKTDSMSYNSVYKYFKISESHKKEFKFYLNVAGMLKNK